MIPIRPPGDFWEITGQKAWVDRRTTIVNCLGDPPGLFSGALGSKKSFQEQTTAIKTKSSKTMRKQKTTRDRRKKQG